MLQQNYPLSVTDHGITKAKQIPQAELRRPKDRDDNGKILPFVTTFNPNNPSVYAIIKSTFESLQENEVDGMRDFELIQSRRQPANLKNILTCVQFSMKLSEVSKCGKSKCECCKYLILSNHYIFKSFTVKSSMSCESSNLIYVVVCPNCQGEYIGETGINRQKLRDRVRIYRQHIRQPKYQMLKVEEHLRNCGNGQFKIFPFLKMRSKDTELRRAFEERFQLKFKTKLNKL